MTAIWIVLGSMVAIVVVSVALISWRDRRRGYYSSDDNDASRAAKVKADRDAAFGGSDQSARMRRNSGDLGY